ncbi:MAG: hypothetical protein KBD83_03720 [Gammaproteobacteria bacterium]|nr:hypothetical protein [Gammaproteobacteria bacterium]
MNKVRTIFYFLILCIFVFGNAYANTRNAYSKASYEDKNKSTRSASTDSQTPRNCTKKHGEKRCELEVKMEKNQKVGKSVKIDAKIPRASILKADRKGYVILDVICNKRENTQYYYCQDKSGKTAVCSARYTC